MFKGAPIVLLTTKGASGPGRPIPRRSSTRAMGTATWSSPPKAAPPRTRVAFKKSDLITPPDARTRESGHPGDRGAGLVPCPKRREAQSTEACIAQPLGVAGLLVVLTNSRSTYSKWRQPKISR